MVSKSSKRYGGIVAGAALLLSLTASNARAASILYYVDLNLGTDQMQAALTSLGVTETIASSPTDFAAKIATGTYDIGIFSEQDSSGSGYSAALAALGTFVAGGGRAIVDDWFTSLGASIAPFDAAFTGTNDTTPMVLTAFTAGVTNPVSLSNPGWGIWTTGLSALPGGSVGGTFTSSGNASIIIGNGGRSIVNGFLNDTAGGPGEQIYINEISDLASIPEPASLTLLASGLAVAWRARRKTR